MRGGAPARGPRSGATVAGRQQSRAGGGRRQEAAGVRGGVGADTKDLVYKKGQEGLPTDARARARTKDVEIWEGEAILWSPFPDPTERLFWQHPQQFLRALCYHRRSGPTVEVDCGEGPAAAAATVRARAGGPPGMLRGSDRGVREGGREPGADHRRDSGAAGGIAP